MHFDEAVFHRRESIGTIDEHIKLGSFNVELQEIYWLREHISKPHARYDLRTQTRGGSVRYPAAIRPVGLKGHPVGMRMNRRRVQFDRCLWAGGLYIPLQVANDCWISLKRYNPGLREPPCKKKTRSSRCSPRNQRF